MQNCHFKDGYFHILESEPSALKQPALIQTSEFHLKEPGRKTATSLLLQHQD